MYNPFRRKKWERIGFAFHDNIGGYSVYYWYDPTRDTVFMSTSRYALFKCAVPELPGRVKERIER